jgi:hypothetical protein
MSRCSSTKVDKASLSIALTSSLRAILTERRASLTVTKEPGSLQQDR